MSTNSGNSPLIVDLSVFENIQQYPSKNCYDFKTCVAAQRVFASLRYYSSFKFQINPDHKDIFINFTKEVYQHPMLMQENGVCKDCNISICDYSTRHYRVDANDGIY